MINAGSLPANTLRYRPHIDGLRAIAVLAVVLYHAKLLGFTGGFVGVDIFFVISGFLITSIIVRDLREGTFSLLGFWERRARRILPALTVVMFFSIIVAHFVILYPDDHHHFGSSVMAQSVFASNVLFMVSDNYFDPAVTSFSPLLHTWTLSVEEQFYLLFPPIVLLCAWFAGRRHRSLGGSADTISRKRERILFISVVGISVASFLLNVWLVDIRPGAIFKATFLEGYNPIYFANAGFYLLPARAWEFGLGVAVALLSLKIRSPLFAEIVTVAGLVSIVGSVFFLSDTASFPGVAALLPTVGAAGIIVANEHDLTKVGRVLSYPWLVFIGLISYSLYLWHWPILVFARILSPAPLGIFSVIGLLASVVVVSWFSYRFVETPFRNKKGIVRSRKTVFALAFGSMAALLLSGLLIYRNDLSNASRIPSSAKATLAILDSARTTEPSNNCFQFPGDQSEYGGLCRIGNTSPGAMPQFVVWGDSHAQVLIPFFDILSRNANVQGVVFFDDGCVPVTGVSLPHYRESCLQKREDALRYIRDKDIKNIFMVASWSSYVMGGPNRIRGQRIAEPNKISKSPEEARSTLQKHLMSMVRQLTDEQRTVYIFKQVPEQSYFDARRLFYQAVATGKEIQTRGVSSSENATYRAYADAAIDSVAKIPGVYAIDPSPILCEKNSGCPLRRGETFLYRDGNHVSFAGAMLFEPQFAQIFKTMH